MTRINEAEWFKVQEPLKAKVTTLPKKPSTLARLSYVNSPDGDSHSYCLQKRQLVTVSRILCLLLDGYEYQTISTFHEMYVRTYRDTVSRSVINSGLKLLRRTGYIDCSNELTSQFYSDLIGITSEEFHLDEVFH